MKVTIAIIAMLIVGSNAGLLSGLLPPIISPTNVVSQAQALLKQLEDEINQAGSDAGSIINGELEQVTGAINNLQQAALGLAQGLVNSNVPGAAALVDALEGVIAQVLDLVNNLVGNLLGTVGGLLGGLLGPVANPTALASPIIAVINSLANQIGNIVNPAIQTLSADIANGVIKPACFTKAVPKIVGNIMEVVAEVTAALKNVTDTIVPQVATIVAEITTELNGLTDGVAQCASVDCEVQLVASNYF